MTISRSSMGSQMRGSKMKKKVKKMIGGGELLGSISPLAGAMTGKGMIGRAVGKGLKNVSPLAMMIDAAKLPRTFSVVELLPLLRRFLQLSNTVP